MWASAKVGTGFERGRDQSSGIAPRRETPQEFFLPWNLLTMAITSRTESAAFAAGL